MNNYTGLKNTVPNVNELSNMDILLLIADLNTTLIQRLSPPVKAHSLEELNERFGENGTKQVPTETGHLEVIIPAVATSQQVHSETYSVISAAYADGCPDDPVKWTGEQIEKHPDAFDLLNTPAAPIA